MIPKELEFKYKSLSSIDIYKRKYLSKTRYSRAVIFKLHTHMYCKYEVTNVCINDINTKDGYASLIILMEEIRMPEDPVTSLSDRYINLNLRDYNQLWFLMEI